MSAEPLQLNADVLDKRSAGCQEINSTTYSFGGVSFSLTCDVEWSGTGYLSLLFTPDFASCMNGCVAWNLQSTQKCVGVSWAKGSYGPAGIAGGSQCLYYYAITGAAVRNIGSDAAQLQSIQGPTVLSHQKYMSDVGDRFRSEHPLYSSI